jgi:pimeloyl-ACP methyl ester carboxylesterase
LLNESYTIEVEGCRLAAEVVYAHDRKPGPTVILCHGIPAEPYRPGDRSYQELCHYFAKSGFNAIFFRFRGAGESTGDFDFSGWVSDLEGVIGWAFETGLTLPGSLSIVGSSAGGAVATHVVAGEPRVSRLVLLASPADMSMLARPDYSGPFLQHLRTLGLIRTPGFPTDASAWSESFKRIIPVKSIGRISPRPVLIVQGELDKVVSLEQAEQLYTAAAQPKELRIIKGAGHRLRMEQAVMDGVIEWLRG